jgi:hypothetical protein
MSRNIKKGISIVVMIVSPFVFYQMAGKNAHTFEFLTVLIMVEITCLLAIIGFNDE